MWQLLITFLKKFDTKQLYTPLPLPTPVLVPPPAPIIKPMIPTNAQQVYEVAKGLLGRHLSAENAADGYGKYGCAESLNSVWVHCFGHPLGGGASTQLMLQSLEDTKRFEELTWDQIEPGCVIMCATGTSTKNPAAHGHVALSGKVQFMSNSSETGEWTANYDRDSWKAYFETYLGFKTRVFKPR